MTAMTNNYEDIDIEQFIEEIKSHPEIWNLSDENYHDRNKKREAWMDVCRNFCDGFDEMKDMEKNEICIRLNKKWKNIKDSYLRNVKRKMKSGGGAGSGKKYIYARQLTFLQATEATPKKQGSVGENDEEEDLEQLEKSAEDLQPSKPICEEKFSKKRKKDMETSLIKILKAPPIPSPVISDTNADRAFFESILPSIKDFTEDQKLELRCEILNIIKRMRMSPCAEIYSQNIPHHGSMNICPTYSTPYPFNYLPQTSFPQYPAKYKRTAHNYKFYQQTRSRQPSPQVTQANNFSNHFPTNNSLQSSQYTDTSLSNRKLSTKPSKKFKESSASSTANQKQSNSLNLNPVSPSDSSQTSVGEAEVLTSEEESMDLFREDD